MATGHGNAAGDITAEERRLVEALRAGDENAFARLVDEYGSTMLRVARLYTSTAAGGGSRAGDVGRRDQGIDRFESRSSLKTWIFRILTNTAKTRGIREGRSIPFASLAAEASAPAVDPERFLGDDTGFPGALGRAAAAVGGRCTAASSARRST